MNTSHFPFLFFGVDTQFLIAGDQYHEHYLTASLVFRVEPSIEIKNAIVDGFPYPLNDGETRWEDEVLIVDASMYEAFPGSYDDDEIFSEPKAMS